jgi:NADH pyrophosphatase NudC (nudix superfamily)
MDVNRFCPDCGGEKQYSSKVDTYYCELCNKWLEEKCTDPECHYCTTRPEKPSQVG